MKKVNEVSIISGLSKRTLQYYDEKGLLTVQRSKENYRIYDEAALQRLWQILLYKEAGFALDEIRTLLNASENDVKKALQNRIEEISWEICRLTEQRQLAEIMEKHGMPSISTEEFAENETTYLDAIHAIRQKIKNGITV